MRRELGVRPSKERIYRLLSKHNALVVHFSGCPKMYSGILEERPYPEDLANVIEKGAIGGICCSTVIPNDAFHGPHANSSGTVGVVLGLMGSDSLVDAGGEDLGSSVDAEGERYTPTQLRDISLDDLETSITYRPSHYNEWILRDYAVIGLFVADPIVVRKEVPLTLVNGVAGDLPLDVGHEMISDDVEITLEEIRDAFEGLPIYTYKDGTLQQYRDGAFCVVNHTEIYEC